MRVLITAHNRISGIIGDDRESHSSSLIPFASLLGAIIAITTHWIYIHNVSSILAPTLIAVACGPWIINTRWWSWTPVTDAILVQISPLPYSVPLSSFSPDQTFSIPYSICCHKIRTTMWLMSLNLRRSQSSIEQGMPLHLTRPLGLLQTGHGWASYCEWRKAWATSHVSYYSWNRMNNLTVNSLRPSGTTYVRTFSHSITYPPCLVWRPVEPVPVPL